MKGGSSYRPSYAGSSIIFGRELLTNGLMKAIDNGMNTSVWCDKWIFDGTPKRPVNFQSLMDLSLKVADLIGYDGSWNLEKLLVLFPPMDV